jgi:spoIIIJ-associated protein
MVKNQLGEWVKVLLDVNNYRAEQKTRLETMAVSLANKAKETGKMVAMVPMSAYERRICHMAVADIEGISSESEGEGEERHIVIRPIEVATE